MPHTQNELFIPLLPLAEFEKWAFLTVSTRISTARLGAVGKRIWVSVGPLVATYTDTAVRRYQPGAPESSKIVLPSTLVSRCKHSNGCHPLQIQGPQHLLLIETITNSVYLGRPAEAK